MLGDNFLVIYLLIKQKYIAIYNNIYLNEQFFKFYIMSAQRKRKMLRLLKKKFIDVYDSLRNISF